MALIRKCNRCGEECRSDFELKFTYSWNLLDYFDTTSYDLCRNCATQFLDFMNGTKPVTLRELLREKFKRKD